MTLYEFRCPEGHLFDKFRPMGAKKTQCDCGKSARRVYSTFSFSFGWKLSDDSLSNPDRRGVDEYVRNI